MKEAIVPFVVFNDALLRTVDRTTVAMATLSIAFVDLRVTRPAGTCVNVLRWLGGLD